MNSAQLNPQMAISNQIFELAKNAQDAHERKGHICSKCFSDYDVIRVKRNSLFKLLFPNIYKYQCTCCGNKFFKKGTKKVGTNTAKLGSQISIMLILLLILSQPSQAATFYSRATGNWNTTSTWSNTSGGSAASSLPTSSDNVVIERSFTVTVNSSATCANLTLGTTSNGTLKFNFSQTLTVSGSVNIISSKGSLNMASGGTLNVAGDFINAGTFTNSDGYLVMNGTSQQIIQSSSVNSLIINNAAGVKISDSTSTLTVNFYLTLTNGEFNLNGKTLVLSHVNSLYRTNGTIDASASTLTFSSLFPSSIVAGFTNKNILNLNVNNSTHSFSSDTIKVTNLVHTGTPKFNTLWLTGSFSYTRSNNVVGWMDAANSTLIIGDGTTRSANFWYQILSNPLPNLIVDCGSGTLLLERTTVSAGTPIITKSIYLKSGTFNPGPYLLSFEISSNVKITQKAGRLLVSTSNYIYGTGIELTYTGNSNDTIGDEIKTGSSIAKLNLNLGDTSKTITSKQGRALSIASDLTLSTGSLALADTLNLGGNFSLAATGSAFLPGNKLVFLNGSTSQSLTKMGGANLSFTNLCIANTSSSVSLNSPITITGTLTLSSGVLDLNSKALSMASGSNLIRGNGSLSGPISAISSYNVSYIGSSNISSTPELFPTSGNINTISIALGNNSSSISTTTCSALNPLGNISITSGTLNLQGLCRIAAGKTVTVTSPASLNTGGNLVLTGHISSPASIANSSGTISGNVSVELFIPSGKRAYRLLGHPFSIAIALSTFSDDIPVTGSGGINNGFDSTSTNNPSAFSFTESLYTGTTNSGWTAFTNTNQTISQYKALRIFYRGPKSQENLLNGSNPVPDSAMITISGTVNSGTLSVPLSYTAANGLNAGWNIISNPYPSNINLGNIAASNRNSIGTFSVWNPYLGTRGAYTTHPFGSSYVLQSGAAFLVKTNSVSNFIFNESDKVSAVPAVSLLKTETEINALEISLQSDDTLLWDKWNFTLNEEAKNELDPQDGFKPFNPDVNVYSLGSDSTKFAIDVRKSVSATEPILLGFTTTSPYHFSFKFSKVDLSKKAYLLDLFTGKKVLLEKDGKYDFFTTSNQNSQGNNRFKIVFDDLSNGFESLGSQSSFNVFPNPATDFLTIETPSPLVSTNLEYSISNLEGKILLTENVSAEQTTQAKISVTNLLPGIYFLMIANTEGSHTIKFIKK
ncbi:MAG: hypothetical protein CFE21_02615 [Bacteroidetes bacterium B1(2017)]|nr:MAG: hypothetical protein CFE21_02615 [Bacteroidetes bacterium B1(2017)]